MLFSVLISTLKSLDISEEEMRTRVVIMSYADPDVQEEKAQRIDASWMRLKHLLQNGKIDGPVRLSGNETDETILLCYSSGVSSETRSLPIILDIIVLTRYHRIEQGGRGRLIIMFLNVMTWSLVPRPHIEI
jgi:hypothetical protein